MKKRIVPAMGNRLRALRKREGWTDTQAAGKFGMSVGGYRKLERGERKLSDAHVRKAQSIYRVTAGEIFDDPVIHSLSSPISHLDLIRRAYEPELPSLLGIGEPKWADISKRNEALSADLVLEIHKRTKLPPSFISHGISDDLTPEMTRKLLDAALASGLPEATARENLPPTFPQGPRRASHPSRLRAKKK